MKVGQHYTDFNVPPYIQAMCMMPSISIVRYTLYNDVLNDIRDMVIVLMAMAFVLSGTQESIWFLGSSVWYKYAATLFKYST